MLEQRSAEKKGYITLKQAAEISGYAPDYIGQLIRSGKISGEQVYSNVAWVTTEDEVLAYLDNKGRVASGANAETVLISQRVAKGILYAVIVVLTVGVLIMQYIFYVSLDRVISSEGVTSYVPEEQKL